MPKSNRSLIDEIINLQPSSRLNNKEERINARDHATTANVNRRKESTSAVNMPINNASFDNKSATSEGVHSSPSAPFDEGPLVHNDIASNDAPTTTATKSKNVNFKEKAKSMIIEPFDESSNARKTIRMMAIATIVAFKMIKHYSSS